MVAPVKISSFSLVSVVFFIKSLRMIRMVLQPGMPFGPARERGSVPFSYLVWSSFCNWTLLASRNFSLHFSGFLNGKLSLL